MNLQANPTQVHTDFSRVGFWVLINVNPSQRQTNISTYPEELMFSSWVDREIEIIETRRVISKLQETCTLYHQNGLRCLCKKDI